MGAGTGVDVGTTIFGVHLVPIAAFLLGAVLTTLATWLVYRLMGLALRFVGRTIHREPRPELVRALRMSGAAAVAGWGLIESTNRLHLAPSAAHHIVQVVQTVLVLVTAMAAFQLADEVLDRAVERATDRSEVGAELAPLMKNLARLTIVLAVAIAALGIWGVNVGPLVASAGLVGAVVALAAQETLSNLFGGVSIILDRYYKPGDYLILDDGQRGKVVRIGIRSTELLTPDDVMITVPNSVMANSKVINQSAPYPMFRMRVHVGVAYGSDGERVSEVLKRVAAEHALVSDDPAPRVWLTEFGDSALQFELLFWCPEPRHMNTVKSDVNFAIYQAFTAEGITIPFPQRTIRVVAGAEPAGSASNADTDGGPADGTGPADGAGA
jgi:small-conductance mechanosensitive channel